MNVFCLLLSFLSHHEHLLVETLGTSNMHFLFKIHYFFIRSACGFACRTACSVRNRTSASWLLYVCSMAFFFFFCTACFSALPAPFFVPFCLDNLQHALELIQWCILSLASQVTWPVASCDKMMNFSGS